MDIEKMIKDYSLVFTGTISKRDYEKENYDKNNIEIDDTEVVSLYDIVNTLITTHKYFIKEFQALDKQNKSDKIELAACKIVSIKGDGLKEEKHRYLALKLTEKSKENEVSYIEIIESDNKAKAFHVKEINQLKGTKRTQIQESEKNLKTILDLFEDYYPLYMFYQSISGDRIFTDESFALTSRINSKNNNLLDDTFTIEYKMNSSYYMGDKSTINIVIKNEKEGTPVDREESFLTINGIDIEMDEEEYHMLLNEIKVNKKYLPYFDQLQELEYRLENKKKLVKKAK